MLRSIGALAPLAACAPPDLPPEMEPRIEIVAPRDDEVVPLLLSQDDTCDLAITVAVDVDNLDIVPRGGEVAPGEGHWHLVLEGREADSLLMVDDGQSAAYAVAGLSPGRVTLVATLQDSQHEPIAGEATESRAEIELAAPQDAACP
jgi:hypothetical protein